MLLVRAVHHFVLTHGANLTLDNTKSNVRLIPKYNTFHTFRFKIEALAPLRTHDSLNVWAGVRMCCEGRWWMWVNVHSRSQQENEIK